MAEKFVLFDEAAKELKMSADDLKKAMEEGKVRSFMDGGKIKFRRGDLDALKTSLGITETEEEISLAPPEATGDMPRLETEEDVPPPPPVAPSGEEDFGIEPLDDGAPAHTPAPVKAAFVAEQAEEEIASLSDFEMGSAEEEGQELSSEEAELLAMQTPGFRATGEPGGASVGMTILLVAAVAVVGFGVTVLLSFPLGINPFTSLTGYFTK